MTQDGDMTTSAPEEAGRLHSNRLSMRYPRLCVEEQMLHDEGVVLININDAEVANLRQLCDDVFGPENFIAQMAWEKGCKNDAKLLSVGHEYILVYARLLAALCIEVLVDLHWEDVSYGAKQAPADEPVAPVEGGHLPILHVAPRALAVNRLSFVETVNGFREGAIITVTDAANRWFDASFGQTLGVSNGQILPAAIRVMN